MEMSDHALSRSRQRGITSEAIDFIVQYGSPERRPGDAVEYRLERRHKARMITDLKRQIRVIERAAGKAVLVSDDGKLITVYHRL